MGIIKGIIRIHSAGAVLAQAIAPLVSTSATTVIVKIMFTKFSTADTTVIIK